MGNYRSLKPTAEEALGLLKKYYSEGIRLSNTHVSIDFGDGSSGALFDIIDIKNNLLLKANDYFDDASSCSRGENDSFDIDEPYTIDDNKETKYDNARDRCFHENPTAIEVDGLIDILLERLFNQ